MTEEHEITALKKREELRRVEQIRREMFQELLDEQKAKSNHEFAIAVRMGKTVSFVTSVSLEWIEAKVDFAKDLPIWERHKDDDGRIRIEAETLDELRQREPDWRRQLPMTRYLALREYHKFPPILVVAWKKWVNMPEDDKWVDGRAMENSITEIALDTKGTFIDLDCEETNFYALDGQHRLMAICGLKELLRGRLEAKNQYGKISSGKGITKEEMVEELDNNFPATANDQPEAQLQSLMNERMGIEIIPAVLKDETYKAALKRLRNIFVHVNKTAKALTKGELALLDEDNGFAIVARQVMVTHKLLAHDRVRTVKGQLGDSAFHYTTLETLVEIARMYLGGVDPLYKKWNIREKGDFPFRPDESELEKGKGKLMGYFDLLSKLPSHRNLTQDEKKSSADYRSEGTEKENILFRPIAQMALADAMATMEKDRGLQPGDVIKRLSRGEKEGKLKLRDRESIWFGVLCDVNDKKVRRTENYRKLCTNLLLHVLGGGTPEDIREDLEEEFRKARKVFDGESTEMKCVGLNGKSINADDLGLPEPWQE